MYADYQLPKFFFKRATETDAKMDGVGVQVGEQRRVVQIEMLAWRLR